MTNIDLNNTQGLVALATHAYDGGDYKTVRYISQTQYLNHNLDLFLCKYENGDVIFGRNYYTLLKNVIKMSYFSMEKASDQEDFSKPAIMTDIGLSRLIDAMRIKFDMKRQKKIESEEALIVEVLKALKK